MTSITRPRKQKRGSAGEPRKVEQMIEQAEAGDDSPDEDYEDVSENPDTDDEENSDDEIALSDLPSDAEAPSDVDIIPHQKLYKDNHAALTSVLATIALPISSLPFHVHQSVTAAEKVTVDVDDDLARETAFSQQALEAAKFARTALLKEGVPFTRPTDYFAEMIKDDEHMEKVSY
jgi:rRNA-processing protein EBP2